MRKTLRTAAGTLIVLAAVAGSAWATPSTQIWIPSTDVQAFGVVHLNVDSYVKAEDDPVFPRTVYVVGPTVGVLPFEKIQAEVGFDLIYSDTAYDSYPLYGHAKLGTPEDSLFKWTPALAAGIYNVGTKSGNAKKGELATNQNIAYGLLAKTIPIVGRISAGYFYGNKKVLLDKNGKSDNSGLLLSWDRTMSEISDKLWLAIDYQGSKSAMGALSFGASWAFAKNASVILGYDIYNDKKAAGKNTVTLQVDLNYP